jgi:hypothetical protein
MVQEDLVVSASAIEKLKQQNFILGKNGTSLYLCLARIGNDRHGSRSQSSEDIWSRDVCGSKAASLFPKS